MRILLIPIVLGFMLLLFAAVGISGNFGSFGGAVRGGSSGVWVSTDDGQSFELRANVAETEDIVLNRGVTSLALGVGPETVFAVSSDLGVFRSDNRGSDWTQILMGDILTTAMAINPTDDSEIYVGAVSNRKARIYKKSQSLTDWTEIYVDAVSGTEFVGLHVDRQNPGNIFALLSNGTLIKSFNGGRDWVLASRVPVVATGLYVDNQNSNNIYITSIESIYKSSNSGFEFEPMPLQLRGSTFTGTQVSSFLMNPNNSAQVYVGSLGEMSRTSDRGQTWEMINILTPETNVPVQQIALNPQNSDDIYYVVGSVLYVSKNRGQSWTTRELPPGVTTVSDILVDTQNNAILYISVP